MGVVIREGVKGSVVSYIGAGIGALTTLFIYPYFLSPEEVGLLRLLLDTSALLAFFAMLGMSGVLIKFFPHFETPLQQKMFSTRVFFNILIGSCIVCGVIFAFSEQVQVYFTSNSSLFAKYFNTVYPLVFSTAILIFFEALSTIYRRIFFPRVIRDILIRVILVGFILLYYYQFINLLGFILGLSVTYGIAAIANYINAKHQGYFSIVYPSKGLISKKLRNAIIRFGGNSILAGFGGVIIGKIDVVMISGNVNLHSTGIYTIAFFIATIIEIPARSITALVLPELSTSLRNNAMEKVNELYKKVTEVQMLIAGGLFLLIWANIDNIFNIMPNGNTYSVGKYVVLFIGLSKLFDLITGLNSNIIAYSKYYFLIPFTTALLGILAIAFNIWLIPHYGIVGAAIASCITMLIYNSLMLILVKKLLGLQPFTSACFRIAVLLLLCAGIVWLMPKFASPYFSIIIQSSIIGGGILIGILYFKISISALEAVRATLRHIQYRLQKK
ncbi:MAG: polysaccharide biosynthesis C-terminal domain-containing protein [Bacteroidales bacterium]